MFDILEFAQHLLTLDESTELLAISAAISLAATKYLLGARPRAACSPSRAVC